MKTLSPVWRLFGPLLAANLLLITTNARDIYVDSNYAGANPDGTKTAPFRRFTRAYQDAKPGDTIFVAPGDYPDPGDFGLPEGDSRGIVVKHWGAPAVIGRFSPVPVGPDGEWADSDSDGMPDVFERRNELDPKSAADALRDRDGDGLTNLEEYERDTKIDVSNFTGGLTGQFAVDPSGSASVSIPITVPPGTAGMQPNLSLVINSRGGPGVVGLGGSIAGIPSITRGGRTMAQDGRTGAVNLDDNDRFYLDGQRLVAISGNYGADGTEYRTEIESFQKVISYGRAGNGPQFFKVWTKAGQVLEFGSTGDARLKARSRPEIITYALNRVTDAKGNFLTVTHGFDVDNGELLPDRVDYCGHVTGPSPYASVRFYYEVRPDPITRRVAAQPVRILHRLRTIRTFVNEEKVLEYRINYELSKATRRSRVKSVVLCDSADRSFAPVEIGDWSDPTPDLAFDIQPKYRPNSTYDLSEENYKIFGGDFNSDGKSDLMHIQGDHKYSIFLGKGDGTFRHIPRELPNYSLDDGGYKLISGDFNGDTRSDFVHIRGPHNATVWLAEASGEEFSRIDISNLDPPDRSDYPFTQNEAVYYPGDYNGDGRTDLLHIVDTEKCYVWLSGCVSGNASFEILKQAMPSDYDPTRNDDNFFIMDLNGDGATDVVHFREGKAYWVWLAEGASKSTPFTISKQTVPGDESYDLRANDSDFRTGDFNGDGKTDFIHFKDKNTAQLWTSIGNGDFVHYTLTAEAIYPSSKFPRPAGRAPYNFDGEDNAYFAFQIADFNGDGRTDLLHFFNDTDVFVWTSVGQNAFEVKRAFANTRDGYGLKGDARYRYQTGDFNGDGKTDVVHFVDSAGMHVWHSTGEFPDMFREVVDGYGNATRITYRPLTDPSVYEASRGAVYPVAEMQGPLYAVHSYSMTDGIGGQYSVTNFYTGGRSHSEGRGFLGFSQVRTVDGRTGIRSTAVYRLDYPFTGQVERSETRQPDTDKLLNEARAGWTSKHLGGTRYFVFAATNTNRTYELDGNLVTEVSTTTRYDDFGNATYVDVDHGDGWRMVTESRFDNDRSIWHLGRLRYSKVTAYSPAKESGCRESGFDYYPDGLLRTEIIEPNRPQFRLQKVHEYDQFGNETKLTVGEGVEARFTITRYNQRGRFPISSENVYGHITRTLFHPLFGKPTEVVSPNQTTNRWKYDSFGQELEEIHPDGTRTLTLNSRNDDNAPEHSAYLVRKYQKGATAVSNRLPAKERAATTYFDSLGRPRRTTSFSFNTGKEIIAQDTEYNRRGLVARSSRSFFLGEVPQWTRYQHDLLGRVVLETLPDDSVMGTRYQGLTTTVTNALKRTATIVKNSKGSVVLSRDTRGNTTTNHYDSFQNLVRTDDPFGVSIKVRYDIRGQKIAQEDPNMGLWTYGYNGFGELTHQTNANGQVTVFGYDRLGRKDRELSREGESRWIFDTAENGIGKLHRAEGKVRDEPYQRVHNYDRIGRPETGTTTIGNQAFTVRTAYDAFGQTKSITYPTGFAVSYGYSDRGDLISVTNLANNVVLWRAEAENQHGQLTRESYGNGLTNVYGFHPTRGWLQSIRSSNGQVQNLEYRHNPLGTVTNRADVLQSLSEAFEYDNLDRLTRARITGGAEKNYDYHEDGRIKYKSDVGTYRYGEAGAGPHAVTSVSGVRNATYRYDRNGNQLEGDGRTISYTSFDKPIEIRKGDHVSLFHYDPEHSRLFQTSNEAGAGTETIYIGGFYEKVSSPSGIQHRHYVSAGSDTIAIFLTSEQPTGPPRTRYLHQDHLGSTDTITDESGTVIERFSYDAFGKRRSGNWQDAASGAIRSTYTERAFTSHLQVDSVEIIHMGGRAYDPTLGRFASADPFIGNTGLQALNRYTYVQNNPLTATDPSGYFLRRFGDNLRDFHREYKDEIRQVAGIATAVAITALTGGGDGGFSWTALAGSMAGGAAGSAVASGGDAKTMLMGAVQGGLTYGVNQVLVPDGFATWNHVDRAAAHGLVGGLSAELQGGSFGHGVAAGAFAETLSPLLNKVPYAPLRATAEAVAGGVGSELGGGKFKNGAMSATFAYLLTPRYDNSTGASDLPLIDVLDLVGKLWSAPNTAIGLAIGGIGRLAGGEVQLENNSIEFTKSPLMDAFPGGEYGAITFGNVIIYGSYAYAAAPHERIHTFQGQFVGPAYLPLNVLGMSLSALSYPVPQLRRHDYVHGRLNFMEGSPFSDNLYGTSP